MWVQWPPRERARLAPRPFAGAFRLVGRTGRGKNVPSGNSKYRLDTCTWPSRPRLPSITNFVPTGNRLGRRPEAYVMVTSCNPPTLPLQCVGRLSVSCRALLSTLSPELTLPCVKRGHLAEGTPAW